MTSWQSEALCSESYDIFFEDFETKKFLDDGVTAKCICSVCPVRSECLDFSFKARKGLGEPSGIWGGHTPPERKKIIKKINADSGLENRIGYGIDFFVKDFFDGVKT